MTNTSDNQQIARRSRRPTWLRRMLVVVVAPILLATGLAVAVAAPAAASGSCVQSSANLTDPYQNHFSQKWTCGTNSGAPVYTDATLSSVMSGRMYSGANTWLLCYRRGEVHSGGNDVWYYTSSDTKLNGQNGWGYMPAAYVWENSDPWPGMPACSSSGTVGYSGEAPLSGYSPPQAYTVPNNRSKVLLVHGYYIPDSPSQVAGAVANGSWVNWGWNCNNYWGQEIAALQNEDFRRENITTIGYYNGDSCDASIINVNHATSTNGTIGASIAHLANNLAWYIWDNYAAYGVNVDVIAHSMGGLIVHAAISGTQYPQASPFNVYNWPPYLYVHDAATLDSPFQGAAISLQGLSCVAEEALLSPSSVEECQDMTPGSDFLINWIAGPAWNNPQARVLSHQNGVTTGGTDWTMVGSDTDSVVSAPSGLNIGSGGDPYLGHKLMYHNMPSYPGDPLNHMALVYTQWNSSQTFADYYCDYGRPCAMSPSSVSALESNWSATTTYTPEVVAVKAIEYNAW